MGIPGSRACTKRSANACLKVGAGVWGSAIVFSIIGLLFLRLFWVVLVVRVVVGRGRVSRRLSVSHRGRQASLAKRKPYASVSSPRYFTSPQFSASSYSRFLFMTLDDIGTGEKSTPLAHLPYSRSSPTVRRYLLVRGYRLIFVAVGLLASSTSTWLGAIIHLSSKELLRNGSYMVLLAILFIDCFSSMPSLRFTRPSVRVSSICPCKPRRTA